MVGVKNAVFCDQNVSVTKELSDWLAPTNQTALLSQTQFGHRKLFYLMRYWCCTSSSSIGICAKFLFRSTNLISFSTHLKSRVRLIFGQIRSVDLGYFHLWFHVIFHNCN